MSALAGQKLTPARIGGYVTESTRNITMPTAGTITTTETVIQTVTWTAVSGIRYKVTAMQSYQSTGAGDLVEMRLRWSAGASGSTSGTQFAVIVPNCDVAGKGTMVTLVGHFTGASGQVTCSFTARRNTGGGNLSFFGTAVQVNLMLVEGI